MKSVAPHDELPAPFPPQTSDLSAVLPNVSDRRRPRSMGHAAVAAARGLLRRIRGYIWVSPAGGVFGRRTVTLSLQDGVIRVVVVKRNRVVAWKSVNPGRASFSNKPDMEDAEKITQTAQELLDEHIDPGSKILVDIPLHQSLFRHFQLPETPRRFLDQVVLSELMETIPFSENEVQVSWQIQKDGDRLSVYAVAVPMELIDDRVRLLGDVGIRPAAVYSAAGAIVVASGVSDGIVAHLSRPRASIVLILGGSPRIVHQPALAEEDMNARAWASSVAEAIAHVASYQDGLSDRHSQISLPVVLTGCAADREPVAEAVGHLDRLEVQPFDPPRLEYPQQFSPGEYATNLGMVLSQTGGPRGQSPGHPVTRLNLLPDRYLPKRVPLIPLLVFSFLFAMAAMALQVTGYVNAAEAEAERLSARVSRTERQQQLRTARADVLNEESQSLGQLVSGLESRVTGFRKDLEAMVATVSLVTTEALPPRVSVPHLAPHREEFTIAGTADTYDDVFGYAANLRTSALFAGVTVQRLDGLQAVDTATEAPDTGQPPLRFELRVVGASSNAESSAGTP